MASGSEDNTIKLWSVETQKKIVTLQGHSLGVTSIVFSPDNKYLASGSDDKTIKLYSLESQKEVTILRGHGDKVTSIAFSPDGK